VHGTYVVLFTPDNDRMIRLSSTRFVPNGVMADNNRKCW